MPRMLVQFLRWERSRKEGVAEAPEPTVSRTLTWHDLEACTHVYVNACEILMSEVPGEQNGKCGQRHPSLKYLAR
jgi:hypothetical protein